MSDSGKTERVPTFKKTTKKETKKSTPSPLDAMLLEKKQVLLNVYLDICTNIRTYLHDMSSDKTLSVIEFRNLYVFIMSLHIICEADIVAALKIDQSVVYEWRSAPSTDNQKEFFPNEVVCKSVANTILDLMIHKLKQDIDKVDVK